MIEWNTHIKILETTEQFDYEVLFQSLLYVA